MANSSSIRCLESRWEERRAESARDLFRFRLARQAGLFLMALAGLWTQAAVVSAATADVRRDAVVDAVDKALPCVVNIGTETIIETRGPFDDLLRQFYGPYYRKLPPKAQYSIGSGVMIDEAGFVLTNDHVVRHADRIWVKLHDGREFQADRIVFASKSDVALLKLRSKPGDKFKPVKFAADDDLLLGETVLALGNPFGLGGSVSRGILSSKNRRPPAENEALDVADWLQTDAAINPGNSGGPLVNLKGELIGINVAVYREGQGIGFAIPIKRVTESLSVIFTPEELKSLWFGARVKAGAHPLTVTEIQPGSPAEKAGIHKGDTIVGINDTVPRNFIELSRELISAGSERPVSLAVMRGGERKTLAVQLMPEKSFFNADLIRRKIGATLQELTPGLAASLRLSGPGGLIIRSVDRKGPAADAELEPGIIIRGINGQITEEIIAAAKILHGRKPGEKVTLDVVVERSRGNILWRDTGTVDLTVQ